MEFGEHIEQLTAHAAAFRFDVTACGPDPTVPTCPGWTVRQLVRHLARVYQWVERALRSVPADLEPPHPDEPPAEWTPLLDYWDTRLDAMLTALTELGPDTPTWVFAGADTETARFWARRQAHETAIHRLDALYARLGSVDARAVTRTFDTRFAADGIDEALRVVIPRQLRRRPPQRSGSVLVHAADTDLAWTVRISVDGEPLRVDVGGPETPADASVSGSADQVYRALWQRPSRAVRRGDLMLTAALTPP
ncbi:maleylpyruvate isomerase family protein [Nocardia cyriacigeorgica]|uniref:Maleylpyruvate isomerase family protein n=1 Tax=Nocardia cyriacigeorgica TaxID=135487 RepID=A0A6P1DEW2_9NOCA|nr:maleylpyruvate isomerase family mycothiol-dependent enzyme [Nocardia cyriacigeorgica]NEW47704.1 maleylpyruvate isomerase family protein [Nocardia cyriacigeorgica]NEW53726.1 maleylpyruvate isomerase family protein [Nocardia cyriacigeorgica]